MNTSSMKCCPFCGGNSVKLVCERPVDTDLYAIRCNACFARGPLSVDGYAFLNWQYRMEGRDKSSAPPDIQKIIDDAWSKVRDLMGVDENETEL